MSAGEGLTRRTLLAGAALLAGSAPAFAAGEQVTKAVAKYQDTPKGQQRCEICLQFSPPNRCKLVEGVIVKTGWCQFFAARENAH
jgi:hypothetical protein